jgi:hypothetical protein
VHTGDVKGEKDPVGTREFAEAIAGNLGKTPAAASARPVPAAHELTSPPEPPRENRLMRTFETSTNHRGCDIYIDTLLHPGARRQAQRDLPRARPSS